MRYAVAVLFVCFWMGNASAQDTESREKPRQRASLSCEKQPNPVKCFTEQTYIALYTCGLESKLVVLGGNGSITDCVVHYRSQSEPLYKRAIVTAAKNQALQSKVKDYYAFWLSAMRDVGPRSGETERIWNIRLDGLVRDTDERGTRIALDT